MERLCIHPKDVCRIIGFSERYARDILKKILKINNKLPHQLVTVEEFSYHYGFDPKEVRKCLR